MKIVIDFWTVIHMLEMIASQNDSSGQSKKIKVTNWTVDSMKNRFSRELSVKSASK